MGLERVLVDTGPLVALLRPADANYEICAAQARLLRYPLLTSWPVLTEAAWLLRDVPSGISRLLLEIKQGLVQPLDLDSAAPEWLAIFLEKYRDLGAQLADASLCYLAERERIDRVFTLDRRDFTVYRIRQNQPFLLLPGS